ncbi:hypothetical protein BDZ89DRAFT_1041843 [Hymenopellis radicata]|nr:hypothetical protein BDZ89DRAFT_1041843 [Hymenopellis radicata]
MPWPSVSVRGAGRCDTGDRGLGGDGAAVEELGLRLNGLLSPRVSPQLRQISGTSSCSRGMSQRQTEDSKYTIWQGRGQGKAANWKWPVIWLLPVDNAYGSWPMSDQRGGDGDSGGNGDDEQSMSREQRAPAARFYKRGWICCCSPAGEAARNIANGSGGDRESGINDDDATTDTTATIVCPQSFQVFEECVSPSWRLQDSSPANTDLRVASIVYAVERARTSVKDILKHSGSYDQQSYIQEHVTSTMGNQLWSNSPIPDRQNLSARILSPDPDHIDGLPTAELAVINVSAGKRYRFRIISISCDPNFIFSIDGHNLTLIETDGENITPITVNAVDIFAGQRYSAVLEATQPVGNLLAALHALEAPGAPGQPFPGGADVVLNMEVGFDPVTQLFSINNNSFFPPTVPVLLHGHNPTAPSLPPLSIHTSRRQLSLEASRDMPESPANSPSMPLCT